MTIHADPHSRIVLVPGRIDDGNNGVEYVSSFRLAEALGVPHQDCVVYLPGNRYFEFHEGDVIIHPEHPGVRDYIQCKDM